MTALLGIKNWMGQEHISVYFGEPSKEDRRTSQFIELTPEQAACKLDDLIAMYRGGRFKIKPPIGDAERSNMIERLHGIIKNSHFEDARENAKSLYKKLTGKDLAV